MCGILVLFDNLKFFIVLLEHGSLVNEFARRRQHMAPINYAIDNDDDSNDNNNVDADDVADVPPRTRPVPLRCSPLPDKKGNFICNICVTLVTEKHVDAFCCDLRGGWTHRHCIESLVGVPRYEHVLSPSGIVKLFYFHDSVCIICIYVLHFYHFLQ